MPKLMAEPNSLENTLKAVRPGNDSIFALVPDPISYNEEIENKPSVVKLDDNSRNIEALEIQMNYGNPFKSPNIKNY